MWECKMLSFYLKLSLVVRLVDPFIVMRQELGRPNPNFYFVFNLQPHTTNEIERNPEPALTLKDTPSSVGVPSFDSNSVIFPPTEISCDSKSTEQVGNFSNQI